MLTTRGGSTPVLGDEPPLDASGANAEIIDRREVNLRWLGASILVGVTGGALIGASVYIAFQGITSLVQQPRRAYSYASHAQGPNDKPDGMARKGDKLIRHAAVPSANDPKESLRLPITIRAGDREVIKVRQFTRISTPLSPTAGLYATNIPPFNPMKLMSQGSEEEAVPEPLPDLGDADVSLTRADLTRIPFQNNQLTLSDSDALAQLEAERAMLRQKGQNAGLPITSQFLLSRPMANIGQIPDITGPSVIGDGLFSGIEVRVIPENVTNMVKGDAMAPTTEGEKEYTLKRGESLMTFLQMNGATAEQATAIVDALGKSVRISSIGEGQKIRVLTGAGSRLGDSEQILRVSLVSDKATTAIAALSDHSGYVAVMPLDDTVGDATQVASTQDKEEEEEGESNEKLGTARLYESLYETATKNGMPTAMIEDLVRIFSSDVDFQRRVTPNDSIEVLYAVDEDNGSHPEMLFAAFSTGGETRRLYRYQAEDGGVDYLDDQGRSLKRFLLRKPITDGILRSTFGIRRHPILRYSKMHTGIDWANKVGTPILAAGNGVIIKAGWMSGYGQRIEIQHANGYVTTYSHQSRFAAGSTVGARVRQGQVIGYVGTTGLSTGPHLHYEVEVNGRLVDPLKIRVPRGRELNGPALAEFKRQRDQVDAILEKAGSTVKVARSGTD